MQDPIRKITNSKRAGSVAHMAEHLPGKHKALTSNSSTDKRNKNKQKVNLVIGVLP
jgi:hypothetical protein